MLEKLLSFRFVKRKASINAIQYVCKTAKRQFHKELGKFTASMEDQLDDIERGKTSMKGVLDDFYGDFKAELERLEKEKITEKE